MVLETIYEAVDVGSMFIGLGSFIIAILIAYWIWIYGQLLRGIVENYLHESVLSDLLLKEHCKKKGIDLEKEMIKRQFIRNRQKDLIRKMKEEIYDDFFGKDKKK